MSKEQTVIPAVKADLVASEVEVLVRKNVDHFFEECLQEAEG